MWKKDIDLIKQLHEKYNFQAELIEPGGLDNPSIADYDISVNKAYHIEVEVGGKNRNIVVPHEEQRDRYLNISRPWSFIDKYYLIENPEHGGCTIEELPKKYFEKFDTIICTSVFEHVQDPFLCSNALYYILKPGGYFINCVPFIFPRHDVIDNWRYSPEALKYIHEESGFKWLEGDWHINYTTLDGIGDYHNKDHLQPIMGCYSLCKKQKI